MAFVPISKEDILKIEIYQEVIQERGYKKSSNFEQIGEYVRACRIHWERERYKSEVRSQKTSYPVEETKKRKSFPLIPRIKKRKTLEEGLIECAEEFNRISEDKKEKKREIDKKALGLIKRCCRKKPDFIKPYFAMYLWFTNRQRVYIA